MREKKKGPVLSTAGHNTIWTASLVIAIEMLTNFISFISFFPSFPYISGPEIIRRDNDVTRDKLHKVQPRYNLIIREYALFCINEVYS